MRRNLFRILTVIFAAHFSLVSLAQSGSRVSSEIASKFSEYCEKVPWEEAWIHTDRDKYIAGEPVWMAAYIFDRGSESILSGYSTLYVELISPSAKPVVQKELALGNGRGEGSLILPDTLSSGRYILRAYTNWMKNFLPVNCFMKEIDIYNPVTTRVLSGVAATGVQALASVQEGVADKGFSFTVNQLPDTVELVIYTNESFRLGNGTACYIFIQTHGTINYNEQVRLYGTTTRIPIARKLLPAGINDITLFSAAGEPVSERLIYTPAEKTAVSTSGLPQSARKRDEISFGIETGTSSLSSLSISVSASDGEAGKAGIADYLVFGSEFGELPDALKEKALNGMQSGAIDEFLKTAKSSWIDWKRILGGVMPDCRYRIENEYQNLSGILVNSETRVPDPNQYILLSRPGKSAWFQYARTDAKGWFSFDVPSGLAGGDIIIQPDDPSRNDIIKLDSQFPSTGFSNDPLKKGIPAKMPLYMQQWSVNYQASRIYGIAQTGDTLKQKSVGDPLLRFYGKPDVSVVMDKYIKLPVMQEVFFELIPGVYLKSKKSVWEITIADPVDFSVYTSPPILMIDGVIIHDASLIANLDPELVEKIEVVRDKYMIGDYLINGIVNVITRDGQFKSVSLPDQAMRLSWKNEDSECSFPLNDKQGTAADKHTPDLRNTLYWNPSLKPDKEGRFNVKFRSSDFVSQYVISIQGVSEKGKVISFEKLLKIGK